MTLPLLGTQQYGYEVLLAVYLGIGAVGSLIGVLFTTHLAERWGKKTTFIVCLLVSAGLQCSYFFVRRDQLGWIYGLQIAGSIASGPLAVLVWTMYADTADFGEWKRGRRATGLIFSASTMTQKFAWALCGKAAGDMLSLTGFVANAPSQTPDTTRGMIHMMSTIPAAFGVLAVLALLLFPLNERRMSAITTELESRRKRLEDGDHSVPRTETGIERS